MQGFVAMLAPIPGKVTEKVNRVGQRQQRGCDSDDDERTPSAGKDSCDCNSNRRSDESAEMHVAGQRGDQRREDESLLQEEIDGPRNRDEKPSGRYSDRKRAGGIRAAG